MHGQPDINKESTDDVFRPITWCPLSAIPVSDSFTYLYTLIPTRGSSPLNIATTQNCLLQFTYKIVY
jgi:hypothetical protein